jgi:hypothetical protein
MFTQGPIYSPAKKQWTAVGLAVLLVGFAAPLPKPPSGSQARAEEEKGQATRWKTPESLKAEHEELHAELVEATQAGGKTGDAAKAVAKLLHPHFEKEEKYAQPPLGLLPRLAEGKVTPEMEQILVLTDKLKADLPQMLEEHKAIVGALTRLVDAAKEEGKLEHADFAEKLMLHARTEEEVLYPTAILIGEYLKLKLQK